MSAPGRAWQSTGRLAIRDREPRRACQWPCERHTLRGCLLAPVIIFALTYVAIAARRLPVLPLDRPAVALCGAVAMVAVGGLGIDEALLAIDMHVVALLFGVMLVAAYLQEARFFRFTAWWVLTRASSARSLLWALVFVAGGLSALLVNDTVCLMLTPLVVAVVVEARLPPLPYLFALASASNLGGVVSFTGNPQNMIIGRAAAGNPSFAEYLALALPIGVILLAVDAALLVLLFRRVLPRGSLPPHVTERPELDRRLMIKALSCLGLFVVLAVAGVSLAGASVTAASVLTLIARVPPRDALRRVDWALLVFFAGLFVAVRGLDRSGALADLLALTGPAFAGGEMQGELALAAVTVAGSNIVSNVPFVLVAVDWAAAMPEPAWAFVVLAFASTLAGNLTLFGSVANIIVFESAGPHGRVGFVEFLRCGAVLTFVPLCIALALLWVERMLFF